MQDSTIEVLNSVIQVLWHLRVHISLLVLEASWQHSRSVLSLRLDLLILSDCCAKRTQIQENNGILGD